MLALTDERTLRVSGVVCTHAESARLRALVPLRCERVGLVQRFWLRVMVITRQTEQVSRLKCGRHHPRRHSRRFVGGDSDFEGVFGVGLRHYHARRCGRASGSHGGPGFGRVVVYVRRAHAHLAPQSSQTGGALQRGIGRDIDRRWVPRPSVISRRIRRDVELGLRARGVGNEGTVVCGGRGWGDVHRRLAATQPGAADRDGSGGTRGRSQRRRCRTG